MNAKNLYLHVRHPAERQRIQTVIIGESMTHQSHAESCDINSIIRRFDNTGTFPPGRENGQYADVVGLQGDLTERINMSRQTLDEAGRALEQHNEKLAADKAAQDKALAEELEQLRAQKRANVKRSGDPNGEE